MHIIVVGVDHTTAPIELRERLSCPNCSIPQFLQAAQRLMPACMLLSTCNRIEFYAVCSDVEQGYADLLHLLAELREIVDPKLTIEQCRVGETMDARELESYKTLNQQGASIADDELAAHARCLADEQAIAHLFGVASGLHSQVLGEPQIQGQVATALQIAQDGGYAGPILSALFRSALATGKRARNETGISRNAVSLSHVAVQQARRLLPNFAEASVLLVGSGKMSELAARNLRDNGAQQLVIVNRTQDHAIELAASLQATLRPFTELREALIDADVVISSTTAPHTIITTELMQSVIEQRNDRPCLLIDIALPRDIEPTVGTWPGIHLYNLDDLQAEIERGIQLRLQETEHVQAIIAEEVQIFQRWLAQRCVVDTICDLRQSVETLRQQELARTFRQLTPNLAERDLAAIQELTTRLLNKFLHTPMLRLKEAAADGQGPNMAEAMRYLFALEEETYAFNDRNPSQQASDDPNAMDCPVLAETMAKS